MSGPVTTRASATEQPKGDEPPPDHPAAATMPTTTALVDPITHRLIPTPSAVSPSAFLVEPSTVTVDVQTADQKAEADRKRLMLIGAGVAGAVVVATIVYLIAK